MEKDKESFKEEIKIMKNENENNYVLVIKHSYYTELLLVNSNLEDTSYNNVLFFFCGFHQIASKYIKKFSKILSMNKNYKLKVILFDMKEYLPDRTVKYFLSHEEMSKNKVIYSYYRGVLEEESSKWITKIYFDAEVDKKALKLLIKEYNYLNFDWKKIMLVGFSMGGRYCCHLAELLNADFYAILILKTYMMTYKSAESSFLKYFLSKETSNKNIKKYDFIEEYYNYIYNKREDIEEVYKMLISLYSEYSKKFSTEKVAKSQIKSIPIYTRYSLNDPLTKEIMDQSVNLIQSQFSIAYVSYDIDTKDKHRIDSAIDLIQKVILMMCN